MPLAWHASSSLQPCGVSYGQGAEEGACIEPWRHADEAEEMQRLRQSAATVSVPHHSCGSPCHTYILRCTDSHTPDRHCQDAEIMTASCLLGS